MAHPVLIVGRWLSTYETKNITLIEDRTGSRVRSYLENKKRDYFQDIGRILGKNQVWIFFTERFNLKNSVLIT